MLERIKTIAIGPYRYRVQWSRDKRMRDRGYADFIKRRIVVSALMQPAEMVEVLNHEILHGVEDAQGLDLPEGWIEQLAKGQAAVWRENPEILLAMYEELTGGKKS